MANRRRTLPLLPTWLATFACLVAIAVRIVLPGLHTHDHRPIAATDGAPLTIVCSCGAVHELPRPVDPSERAGDDGAALAPECACLAGEIELSTPGAPPAPATLAEVHDPRRGEPAAAPLSRHAHHGERAHPCRAPPETDRPFVSVRRCAVRSTT